MPRKRTVTTLQTSNQAVQDALMIETPKRKKPKHDRTPRTIVRTPRMTRKLTANTPVMSTTPVKPQTVQNDRTQQMTETIMTTIYAPDILTTAADMICTTVSTAQTITRMQSENETTTVADIPTSVASTLLSTYAKPPQITHVQHKPNLDIESQAEIQTAEALLELHATLEAPALGDLDIYDNAKLMPVDATPVPDYSKDYPPPTEMDQIGNEDTDDTIPYAEINQSVTEPGTSDNVTVETQEHSPPGRFRYRHHGI